MSMAGSMAQSSAARQGACSTSGRPPCCARAAPQPRRFVLQGKRLQPCHVTNEGREMMDEELQKFNEEYLNLGPQYQIPDPELGPLERRVQQTYVDGLLSGEINLKDSEYWFTEPEGGWNQTDKIVRKAKVVPSTYASAAHAGSGRRPLRDYHEGMELDGIVEAVYFYHGVKVDIGGEFDGLIPAYATEENWAELIGEFHIDTPLRVRIHKIFKGPRCRFPIQLELLEPAELAHKMMLPDMYAPAYDFRGMDSVKALQWAVGEDIEDVTGGKSVEINTFPRSRLDDVAADVSSIETVEEWPEMIKGGIGPSLPEYMPPNELDDLVTSLYY